MRKNDYDFSVPNRQSYVAILMILFKTGNVIIRQIFPVLIVILVGGSKQKGDYILWLVITISILTMVYSIINFFLTYFIVENDELVLHTGIFNRKKLSIAFDRIQTINFEQNIVHQFFGVSRLKVDSAGTEKNEFEFYALDTTKAYALRDLVMAEKTNVSSGTILGQNKGKEQPTVPSYATIMMLSPMRLLKVGITENHLKSGGLIFLFFFWIYQNLQDVGVDIDEYSEDVSVWEMGIYTFMFVLIVLFVVAVFISLVRSVVRNFDLQFLRSPSGFKIVHGLFTKKEVSALDHKIQHISWSDNLLKRWIGFKDLSLYQASGKELGGGQNISIPGCSMDHITSVVESLFGKTYLESIDMQPIDKRYFIRFSVLVLVIALLTVAAIWWLSNPLYIIPVILIGLYFIITRYISYRKIHYGFNDELLYIKGGVFGDKADILPMYKIQALEWHQSPYQTKHQLGSLTLYTAAGRLKIPYLPLASGRYLSDLILFKVASEKRRWM